MVSVTCQSKINKQIGGKNMRLNKRLLMAFIPLCILSTAVMVYAASFLIQSPVVTVTIDYYVSLEANVSGSTVILTATLTNKTVPIQFASLKFYHTDTSGSHTGSNATELATVVTNSIGVAVWNAVEGSNGVYHYRAEWTTP
jgi:hypothetical protein